MWTVISCLKRAWLINKICSYFQIILLTFRVQNMPMVKPLIGHLILEKPVDSYGSLKFVCKIQNLNSGTWLSQNCSVPVWWVERAVNLNMENLGTFINLGEFFASLDFNFSSKKNYGLHELQDQFHFKMLFKRNCYLSNHIAHVIFFNIVNICCLIQNNI